MQSYWRKYQRQSPYRLFYNQEEDLAVVRYKGLLWPLFLRKFPDGFWKMDVTKAWAFSQANNSMTDLYPLYQDHPWIFAYPEYRYQKSLCNIPSLLPASFSVKDEILRLEKFFGKGVYNRNSDSMKASAYLVGFLVKFSSSMKFC